MPIVSVMRRRGAMPRRSAEESSHERAAATRSQARYRSIAYTRASHELAEVLDHPSVAVIVELSEGEIAPVRRRVGSFKPRTGFVYDACITIQRYPQERFA